MRRDERQLDAEGALVEVDGGVEVGVVEVVTGAVTNATLKHAGGGGEGDDKREDEYGECLSPETIVRRMERSVRRIAVDGRKDNLVVKLHPETAIYLMENSSIVVTSGTASGITYTISYESIAA